MLFVTAAASVIQFLDACAASASAAALGTSIFNRPTKRDASSVSRASMMTSHVVAAIL